MGFLTFHNFNWVESYLQGKILVRVIESTYIAANFKTYFMTEKIAIIDCGTNTFHLLIVELYGEGNYRTIFRERIVVKIGQGGINQNIIVTDAEQRAISAIKAFQAIIEKEETSAVYAFATSAFRNAKNGKELRDKIEEITGISIQIIHGQQEAELIYKGVNLALDLGDENCLVMDIGGGSVEFIIGNQGEILWSRSFEIGAQRLLDLFHKTEPISENETDALMGYLKKELESLLGAIEEYKPETLVGSSGTFDTISDIYCLSQNRKPANGAELPLNLEAYYKIHKDLLTKNREERMSIRGMIEMRVTMIVVASCVIDFVLKHSPIKNIRVSTFALKEGVLSNILNEQKLSEEI